ncbi:ABC transporter ATP-binding protein [Streptomyces sp. MS2A]|nr:ABC transporter ATP-binding protein [Streptomyces sp. MS2A]
MTDVLPVAGPRDTLRALGPLLSRRRGSVSATILLLLAGSASALAIPPVLGRIVDIALDGGSPVSIASCALVLAGAGAASAVCSWWGGRLLVASIQGMLAELREGVFDAALRVDPAVVEDAGSADVVSRLTGDVDAVTEAASGVLPRFVGALFTIVLTAAGMAVLDPWLAVAALVAVPIQFLAAARFLRRSRPLYVRLRREEASRAQAIIEGVTGAETIRAHGREEARLALVARRSLTAIETQRSAARARNVFNGTLNLAELAGLVAVLATGLWRVGDDAVTVGAVTAEALFFHRLFGPIGALLSSIDDLQRAHAGLERLAGLLGLPPQERTGIVIRDGAVILHDVSYSYRSASTTRPAVDGVSLSIPTGSCVVIVGASGSGKSTLARLVCGLATPDAGTVLVGGAPAARAMRADHRPAVMTVTQETHLFPGTLADNLRLARAGATDEELREALDRVGAEWTGPFEDGVDAELGPDLDAHRIQQIALARVILADPPVVVLDEATADAGSDAAVDRAVAAVARHRTAVVIAHRLHHAALADDIVVLENGRIVEHGTMSSLLAREGPFRTLWAAWRDTAPRRPVDTARTITETDALEIDPAEKENSPWPCPAPPPAS